MFQALEHFIANKGSLPLGTYSLALSTFALVEIDTFAPGFLALLPPKMTHLPW